MRFGVRLVFVVFVLAILASGSAQVVTKREGGRVVISNTSGAGKPAPAPAPVVEQQSRAPGTLPSDSHAAEPLRADVRSSPPDSKFVFERIGAPRAYALMEGETGAF